MGIEQLIFFIIIDRILVTYIVYIILFLICLIYSLIAKHKTEESYHFVLIVVVLGNSKVDHGKNCWIKNERRGEIRFSFHLFQANLSIRVVQVFQ